MSRKPRQFHDPKLARMAEVAADLGLTMATGGPYASFQSYFGMNKEATRGTAPAWTNGSAQWIPINPNPTLAPTLTWQVDDSLRGSPVGVYDDILLTNYVTFDFKGFVFADTFPALLLATLGGPDTVTGSVAPYTHYIPLLNDPQSGSQPPSYTCVDVDLIEESGVSQNAKQFTAGQMVSLAIDYTATGALNYTAKFIGQQYTQIAKPTATWSTEALIPAYNGTFFLGGSQSYLLTKGTLMLDRKTSPIHTIQQTPSPYRLFAGAFVVTGTLEFLALADETNMLYGTEYIKQVMTLQFNGPLGGAYAGHYVYFHFNQVQLKNPKVMRDQPYTRVTVDFSAEANVQDAVTGFSPMYSNTVNGVSAAY